MMSAQCRSTGYLAFVNKRDVVDISQGYPSLWLSLKREAEVKVALVSQVRALHKLALPACASVFAMSVVRATIGLAVYAGPARRVWVCAAFTACCSRS